MPCYDQRDDQTKYVYETGISPEKLQSVRNEIAELEASICAICNELDRRGIAQSVLVEASRNGLIDLMSFWEIHTKKDSDRIAADIHQRYSKDEIAIIKQIITNA